MATSEAVRIPSIPVRVMKCWMLGVSLKSTGSSLWSNGGWSWLVEKDGRSSLM